jgi:transposase
MGWCRVIKALSSCGKEEYFMADFATPPLGRDQLVLFQEKLDDIIASDHPVRLLDDILDRLDWKAWEAAYVLVRGQPPIHPRVVAGVILYGITKRIRTSRALEEALEVRTDFRWLAQGRSIDHTTLSRFRTKNKSLIKELFVQIALVARNLGYLPLATLGFDGTRMRASNRRSGSRTPEELQKAKVELSKKFDELEAKIALADKQDDEQFGDTNDRQLSKELADVSRRRNRVDAALAEIERLEKADQKIPARVPTTDPQSRITPNKDGGFAPNYTPTATVDVDSGLIVAAGVIANTDEDKHMIEAVKEVMESFSLEHPPKELLADGMMSTGENLVDCKEMGIDFYSPIKLGGEPGNPAIRKDLSQAVSSEDVARLPTTTTKHRDGTTTTQFNKNAFVYDKEKDCYWCPAGKSLPFTNKTSETENGRKRVRLRYLADPQGCASCQLKSHCIVGATKQRMVCHEQHESHRVEHANKMATTESKEKYSRRRHAGERPFATIKSQFGARGFLTRGLTKVSCEWQWLISAFNLQRLMSLITGNAGPPAVATAS